MPVFTAAGTVAGVLVGTMSSGRNAGSSVAVPAAAANALLRRATTDYERRMNAKPKC